MTSANNPFGDATAIAHYANNARQTVPAVDAVHRMAAVLLAERVPSDGRILVLGAGGGLELKAFADQHPGWTFDGVDPAAAMLEMAARTVGEAASRVAFHEGYIDDAPQGPFDGAACLLTLHFLASDERLRTLREVRTRLKPGAPFVVMHMSFPQEPSSRERWRDWEEGYIVASGGKPEDAHRRRIAVGDALPILSPEDDKSLLSEAGFSNITIFYTAFTFRGWVAYA